MVGEIACFLTCGYTEAGAMQSFLGKINARYRFRQYLPNTIRKRKGDSKIINRELSGLTGEGLLQKIYEICRNHKEEILSCKAILIEDDLDGRFARFTDQQIAEYNQDIVENVHRNLGSEDIPVFLLYASPEIESWFIADWEHGFQRLYCDKGIVRDLDEGARKFFPFHLRQYIDDLILGEYAHDIEEYGWIDGKYVKLSDQIIRAIQTDVRDYIQTLQNVNTYMVRQIMASRDLYYSKRVHGDRMLRTIQPDIVERKCKRYYRKAYYQIREFG